MCRMGPGVLSLRTFQLIEKLRSGGIAVVYITGARYSTLVERLPLMPIVDCAFAENGGRYLVNECRDLESTWTKRMEAFCGPRSFHGQDPLERPGVLWDFARRLNELGFALDTRSYFFGVRVDLRKQSKSLQDPAAFERLLQRELPSGLSSASNLGNTDIFPVISGKGNAVRYYLLTHGLSREDAVAMFDDENDLPMAEHVGRCFVLQATHPSVQRALQVNRHWVLSDAVGVLAAEQVLTRLCDSLAAPRL